MNLREKQSEFAQMVALLIQKAALLGYDVTLGDAYRDPRCPYGSEKSLHRKRLAIDLNLFNDAGQYLTSTDDHKPLGEWWQKMGGEWGGKDNRNDGNHYSWPHEGRW